MVIEPIVRQGIIEILPGMPVQGKFYIGLLGWARKVTPE
jgi:hypothetical protein